VGRLAARRGTSAASQWTARRSGRLPRTGEWRRPCSGTGGAETGGSTQGRSSTGIYSPRPTPRRPGSPPPGTGEMCSAGPCRRAPRPVRDRGTTKLVFQRIDMTNLRHCGTAIMKCLLKFTRRCDSALNQISNTTRWLSTSWSLFACQYINFERLQSTTIRESGCITTGWLNVFLGVIHVLSSGLEMTCRILIFRIE
jgi:hypothetical protein